MMEQKASNRFRIDDRILFLREFIKHPLQIGSVIPSSRHLERRIVETMGAASARTVIELGPGVGGMTRAMLRAMPRNAKLLSIEINPHFNAMVGRIADKRLIAHLGSAADLEAIMARYRLPPPDAVVSGIPFSTMPRSVGCAILDAISSVLPPSGRFVAYQVNRHVATLCRPYLGRGRASRALLNIPPMHVFEWVKRA